MIRACLRYEGQLQSLFSESATVKLKHMWITGRYVTFGVYSPVVGNNQ